MDTITSTYRFHLKLDLLSFDASSSWESTISQPTLEDLALMLRKLIDWRRPWLTYCTLAPLPYEEFVLIEFKTELERALAPIGEYRVIHDRRKSVLVVVENLAEEIEEAI